MAKHSTTGRAGHGERAPGLAPATRWMRIRAALAVGALALALALLVARLAHIQIVEHDRYAALAGEQQVLQREIGARRGDMTDRAGRLLATSVRTWSVFADPAVVANREATATLLAGVLEMDRAEVRAKLDRPGRFVWIRRQAPDDQAEFLRDLGLKGVHFRKEWLRTHPNGSVASQALGLTDVDGRGLSGIELQLDGLLRPVAGRETVACDAGRRVIRCAGDRPVLVPRDGCNVELTIDAVIQNVAREELAAAVNKHAPAGACAVVLDTPSGAVLAMANWPDFDPDDRAAFDPRAHSDHIVADAYEFGSVMKPFAVAAALDAGAVTPDTEFFCHNGAWRIGRRTVHDAHAFGRLNVNEIIEKSSNIGVAQVARQLGPRRFYTYLRLFGLGEATGIDLPGESNGILRPLSRWTSHSLVSISFGQELAVSPLAAASAFTVFANQGLLYRPQIVSKITRTSTGEALYALKGPVRARRVISEKTAGQVLTMLRRVVVSGTGRRADINTYAVAGKTGTAQLARPDGRGYLDGVYVSSFIGIAPVDRPRVCVLVSLEAPTKGGSYGGTVAAPACAKIIERTLRYLEVPAAEPDRTVARGET